MEQMSLSVPRSHSAWMRLPLGSSSGEAVQWTWTNCCIQGQDRTSEGPVQAYRTSLPPSWGDSYCLQPPWRHRHQPQWWATGELVQVCTLHVAEVWCVERRQLVRVQEDGADERHWGLSQTTAGPPTMCRCTCSSLPCMKRPTWWRHKFSWCKSRGCIRLRRASTPQFKQGHWQLGGNSMTAFWVQSSCCLA